MKFFSKKSFIIPFLSLSIIFLSFLPTIIHFGKTPKDHWFTGAHNYPHDYFVYLSEILQSKNGSWTTKFKFTSESQIGIFTRPYYIFAGKIAAIFSLSPVTTYHLMRLFAAILLLSIYYAWIKEIFKTQFGKSLAFFLLVISASLPKIFWQDNHWQISTFFSWWTETDALRSWTFLPHHVLNNALSFFLLLAFAKTIKNSGQKTAFSQSKNLGVSWFLLAPSSIILGLSSPPHLIIVLLTMGLLTAFLWIKTGYLSKNLSIFIVVIFVFSFISLAYLYSTYKLLPYKELNNWEKSQNINTPPIEYLASIGPNALFALIGMLLVIFSKKISTFTSILILWPTIVLFLLTSRITHLIGVNPIRLVGISLYLPMAVFSTMVLLNIKRVIPQLFFVIIFLILLNAYQAFWLSLNFQIKEFPTWAYNLYPDNTAMESFKFLAKNTDSNNIVLADLLIANLIPSFSGNTVFVNQSISTLNFKEKYQETQQFLKGGYTPTEAKTWLAGNNIKYVFWGTGEKQFNPNLPKLYPFLKPVFEKEYITIFKTN